MDGRRVSWRNSSGASDFSFDPAVEELPPADVYRDHVGIHPQKQPGYCYVGAAVLRGRITAEQMHAAADLADRFAAGELRTTNMQNLLIVNVPAVQCGELAKELDAIGLRVGGSSFYRGTVACSGTEFCKLAITETKSFSRWLVEELEERLPGFDQHLKLHVTGCPNSCGQHWIADIGIDGKKMKVDGQSGRCLLLLPWRRARSAPGDGAARGISLPCDRGSGCDREIAPAISRARVRQARICASSLPGIPTRSCGSFWLASRWKRWPAICRRVPVGRSLAQSAGGDGD